MGHTLIEKIIGNKVGHEVKPGDIVTVDVDWCMIDDIMVPFAVQKFEEMGFDKVANPDSVVLIYDHFLPATQVDDSRHFRAGDEFADKYGIKRVHRTDGICHQLMTEAGYVKPGDIVCVDTAQGEAFAFVTRVERSNEYIPHKRVLKIKRAKSNDDDVLPF